MTPEELIAEARGFLTRSGGLLPALWPRAAAILGRQALEGWVRNAAGSRAPTTLK